MPMMWCCPFFKWEEKLTVHCEGAKLRFGTDSARLDYARRYCANAKCWKDCTLAQNLIRDYERNEKNETNR